MTATYSNPRAFEGGDREISECRFNRIMDESVISYDDFMLPVFCICGSGRSGAESYDASCVKWDGRSGMYGDARVWV